MFDLTNPIYQDPEAASRIFQRAADGQVSAAAVKEILIVGGTLAACWSIKA